MKDVARDRGILTAEGHLKGAKNKKEPAAEKVLEALQVHDHLDRFFRRWAYGGGGNPYRHGEAPGEARTQAVYLLLVLAVAFDQFSGSSHIREFAEGAERWLTLDDPPVPTSLGTVR